MINIFFENFYLLLIKERNLLRQLSIFTYVIRDEIKTNENANPNKTCKIKLGRSIFG